MTRSTTFSVYASHKDYGRVVGSEGKNFHCFETLAKLMSARDDKEAELSVIPPEDRSVPKDERFVPNPKWGKAQILPLLKDVCVALFENAGTVEITEPDPIAMNIEVKVDASEFPMSVIDGGDRVTFIEEKDTEGVVRAVELTEKKVEKILRTIFHAAGKNNGRNISFYLIGINYPTGSK
jgi:hypothetical protein